MAKIKMKKIQIKRRYLVGVVKIPAWEIWAADERLSDYAALQKARNCVDVLESSLRNSYYHHKEGIQKEVCKKCHGTGTFREWGHFAPVTLRTCTQCPPKDER